MKTARTRNLLAVALVCALAASTAHAQTAPKMKMTTDIPPEITTPDTVSRVICPSVFEYRTLAPALKKAGVPEILSGMGKVRSLYACHQLLKMFSCTIHSGQDRCKL